MFSFWEINPPRCCTQIVHRTIEGARQRREGGGENLASSLWQGGKGVIECLGEKLRTGGACVPVRDWESTCDEAWFGEWRSRWCGLATKTALSRVLLFLT